MKRLMMNSDFEQHLKAYTEIVRRGAGPGADAMVPRKVLDDWFDRLHNAALEASDEHLIALESDLLSMRDEILRYL